MILYPKLVEGLSFHLNPRECFVFWDQTLTSILERPCGISDYCDTSQECATARAPASMEVINLDAFEVMKLCDGTRSVEELLNELLTRRRANLVSGSAYADAVVEFLRESQNRGHIKFAAAHRRKSGDIKITGSTDVFVPIHISLELTRRCNLRCSYCYCFANPWEPQAELPGSLIIKILSSWVQCGLRAIELTGGEPLLHPDFWAVLEFCLDNLTMVGILSNGVAFDAEIIEKLAEHRQKISLSISLDGCCPETHDKIRGKEGAFESTVKSIRQMARKGLRVRVAMTVTPENWREIEPTLLLSKDLGASYFGWSPVIPFGKGRGVVWDLTPEEVKELSNKESELMEKHKGFVPVIPKSFSFLPRGWNCGIGWKNVVVGPSGLVRTCLLLPERTCAFADLRKETVTEAFRKRIVFRLKDLPMPSDEVCGACELKSYCTSCPVRALSNRMARVGKCAWVRSAHAENLLRLVVDSEDRSIQGENRVYGSDPSEI